MDSWNISYRPPQMHEQSEDFAQTLYVGNLPKEITQDYILYLFGQIGECKSCKMIVDPTGINDPYCFVEFFDHKAAENAKNTMNGRVVFSKNIKVNWATTSVKKKERTYSLFVGDLTPEIDEGLLAKTFQPFGSVVDARVVKDMNTGHSKGYGFVAFSKEADADHARTKMNGYYLGGKAIRTNWAARKPIQTRGEAKEYDTIYKKTGEANTTVYIGNTPDEYKESDVRGLFDPHGDISEVRVYPDRNYAFVKYGTHEQATRAIVACHGHVVEDRSLKCDWGRDEGQSKSNSSSQSYGQQQQQQQQQAAYQQAALLYNQFSQQAAAAAPFQQQPQQQQQFNSNPPPGIYSQQAAFVGSSQSQMYPYFDSSSMMVPNQFASYTGQENSHSTYLGQQSSTGATSQGSFGYQQQ